MAKKAPEPVRTYRDDQRDFRLRAAPKVIHHWSAGADSCTIDLGIRKMKAREADPYMRQIYKENAWNSERDKNASN